MSHQQLKNNTFKGPAGEDLRIKLDLYANGQTKVQLWDAEGPAGCLSCSIDYVDLGNTEFLAKTWSENEELAAAALQSGLFEDTDRRVAVGFAEAQVWRIREMVPEYPIDTCQECRVSYLCCPACGASGIGQTKAREGETCWCGRGVVFMKTSIFCCQRHHHHIGSTCPHCGQVG